MSDLKQYLLKTVTKYQGTHEERTLADILFDDTVSVSMGDQRLNAIAALTYNTVQCNNIFNLLIKSLNAQEFPWKTLYKALMVYHTIVLFGSEIAVDKTVTYSKLILNLRNYNSAMVSTTSFIRCAGGTDYGAPVRMQASQLLEIIDTDASIRRARAEARAGSGQDSLVPVGTDNLLDFDMAPPPPNLAFGQSVEKSIGAGYDLSAVPGMYENRPDRYFDDMNDIRKPKGTGDHQFTREAMNPDSLLDLVFSGDPASNDHLPPVDFLPALAKQRELEALLAQQQEQLRILQEQQQRQLSSCHGYPASQSHPNDLYVYPPRHIPEEFQHRHTGGVGDYNDLATGPWAGSQPAQMNAGTGPNSHDRDSDLLTQYGLAYPHTSGTPIYGRSHPPGSYNPHLQRVDGYMGAAPRHQFLHVSQTGPVGSHCDTPSSVQQSSQQPGSMMLEQYSHQHQY